MAAVIVREFRHSGLPCRAGAVVSACRRTACKHRNSRENRASVSLLADEDHAVAEAYGVWGEKSMYGRKYHGILRTTFILDERGRVARVFNKVKPEGHAAEVLAALKDRRNDP
jgi:peroxiredoxin Q/BCP